MSTDAPVHVKNVLPSLGLTKPLVTPEQLAATVSPLITLRRVNSEDSVCMTMGRSLSRTWTQRIKRKRDVI